MSRCIALLISIACLDAAQAQTPPQVIGKAYLVADLSSGQILASEKADERFEPASLTKLMTAYLVFQALKDKKLALGQPLPDCTIMPRISSSTVTGRCGSMNMRAPLARHAFSDTGTGWPSASFLSFSA